MRDTVLGTGQMADEIEEAEGSEEDGEGEGGAAPKRRLAGRTLVLFIALPAVVVIAAVVGAVAFFQPFSGESESGVTENAQETSFYDLPEILVNLSQQDKRSQFLKLKIALEISDRDASSALEPVMPRVLDTFQIYLRELRTDDLEGSAGIYRLKEELLRRVNLAIRPHKVDRILFKEIIVQ
jgi:flagellar FliL protein